MRRSSSNSNPNSMVTNSSSSSSSNSNNHSRRGRRRGGEDDIELGLSIGGGGGESLDTTLFVKVYMEGQPIGRKLNMMAHSGYDHLIATLDHMFNANIILFLDDDHHYSHQHHVLTYQDDEGDWLMIGDVPWELFLSSVKRLNISRAYPS